MKRAEGLRENKKPSFVVIYDDFNPFLDRFVSRIGRNRPLGKSLDHWKLWDHMDAILSLAVTQLVSAIIHRSKAEPVGDGKSHSWSVPHARDIALLAALYDQSTAETFPSRWRKLRWRVGYGSVLGRWPTFLGLVSTVLFIAAVATSFTRDNINWLTLWWPWIILAGTWTPWLYRRCHCLWKAFRIVRGMRTGNRTVGQLAKALAKMPEVDLAGTASSPHRT